MLHPLFVPAWVMVIVEYASLYPFTAAMALQEIFCKVRLLTSS